MRTYARNTKVFFETLSSIQDNAVYQALAEYDKSDSLEDLLYNTTYEAITSAVPASCLQSPVYNEAYPYQSFSRSVHPSPYIHPDPLDQPP